MCSIGSRSPPWVHHGIAASTADLSQNPILFLLLIAERAGRRLNSSPPPSPSHLFLRPISTTPSAYSPRLGRERRRRRKEKRATLCSANQSRRPGAKGRRPDKRCMFYYLCVRRRGEKYVKVVFHGVFATGEFGGEREEEEWGSAKSEQIDWPSAPPVRMSMRACKRKTALICIRRLRGWRPSAKIYFWGTVSKESAGPHRRTFRERLYVHAYGFGSYVNALVAIFHSGSRRLNLAMQQTC